MLKRCSGCLTLLLVSEMLSITEAFPAKPVAIIPEPISVCLRKFLLFYVIFDLFYWLNFYIIQNLAFLHISKLTGYRN
jgi:hypothetical protein